MKKNNTFTEVIDVIQKSINFSKCRKCGCMKKSLESMENALSGTNNADYSVFLNEIQSALSKTEPTEYT